MSLSLRSPWIALAVLIAAAAPFVYALSLAPRGGDTPLLALGFLAGPLALGIWLAFKRPVAVLVGAYIGIAPIDFLLVYSNGITISRIIGLAATVTLLATIAVRGPAPSLPRSAVAWLAAFGFMVVTLLWSGDPSRTLERLMSTGLPILIMTLVALVPCDRTDLRVMLLGVVAGVASISAYCVIDPPPLGAHGGIQERMVLRIGHTAVDPNGLAFSLIVPLAILLAVVLSPGDVRRRVLAAGIALIVVFAILLTESRGGLLGLAAMLAWLAIRSRERLIVSLTMLAALTVTVMHGGTWQRLFSHASANAEGAGRLPIWRVGFEAFRQRWLIGNGYGTFTDAYNQAYLLVPQTFHSGWSREAHNLPLSVFTELGVFGGALVMYAWWSQFRAFRDVPRTDGDAWLRLAMEAGVLGVFVTAMFLDILVLKPAWVAPILIAAIASVRSRERAAAQNAVASPARTDWRWRWADGVPPRAHADAAARP
ncbi:MAG: hypothetical protein NVS3B7_11870 [Candidatus Elarobacter sp.]